MITMVQCDNYRCKFNFDNLCGKNHIVISYYFEERDDSGYESCCCESMEAK